MKKASVIIILLIAALALLSACNRGKDSPGSGSPSAVKREDTLLKKTTFNGSGNGSGFYYFDNLNYKYDPSGVMYMNLRYVDYATKQDIYLCGQPNCKHDNESCASYFNSTPYEANVIAASDKLYVILNEFSEAENQSDAQGQIAFSFNGGVPVLYQMNLDGSDRKRVYEFESGVKLKDTTCFLKGDKIYFSTCTTRNETEGHGVKLISENEELIELDLNTKAARVVGGLQNCYAIGVYNGRILFCKSNYEKNPSEMTDSEFWNSLNSLTLTFFTLDVGSGEVMNLYDSDYKSMENYVYDDGKLYFCRNKGKTLNCLDLATNQVSVVTDQLPEGFLSFALDGMIYLNCDDGKAVNAEFTDSYMINAETGEITKRDLFIKKPRMPVEILDVCGDYYLVHSHCTYKDEKTWAGTMQTNITGYTKSLIKKDDYIRSKASYIDIDKQ